MTGPARQPEASAACLLEVEVQPRASRTGASGRRKRLRIEGLDAASLASALGRG
jgi:uncharacterized protein YggU (UPF0235/DUF167 family)